jgi:hypothetical protein
MPIAAAIVGDGLGFTAPGTTISVTAKRRRATAFNGRKHLAVQSCQPRPLFFDEVFACRSNDISHLDGWLFHCF